MLALLAALGPVGCNQNAPGQTQACYVLPDGYRGVFCVQFADQSPDSIQIAEDTAYLRIPASGRFTLPLKYADDDLSMPSNISSVAFESGRAIPLFSLRNPPSDVEQPVCLALLTHDGCRWFAIGKHQELNELRLTLTETGHQNLAQYLPSEQTNVVARHPSP